MPDHRRVTNVSRPQKSRDGASTSGIQTSGVAGGPTTQESIAAERN